MNRQPREYVGGVTPGTTAVTTCDDGGAWDRFVRSRPDATAYHQFAWKDIFERAFGHQTLYLAAVQGSTVVGVLPLVEFDSWMFGRFAVSLPFVNYGGVLADEEVAGTLVEYAVSMAGHRRWTHVELRHTARRLPTWPARQHKVGMSRLLPATAGELWQSVDRKARNLVRKAEKAGCSVVSGGGELLSDFYHVFAHNMRDLGTPVYGRRFFEEVVRTPETGARIFVVRWQGRAVAAATTVAWRDRVEVPWASSLRAHTDKSPNMLMYWAMLRDAVDRQAGVFDFGRSTPGEGTYQFKRQWGAEPEPLNWEYPGLVGRVPDQGPGNPKFRTAIAAWKRLPVAVATRIGPHVVRNIP